MRSTPIGKTSPAFSGDVLFQPVSFILTTVCTAPGAGPDLVLSLPPQHTNEGVPQDTSRLSPTAQVSVGKAGLMAPYLIIPSLDPICQPLNGAFPMTNGLTSSLHSPTREVHNMIRFSESETERLTIHCCMVLRATTNCLESLAAHCDKNFLNDLQRLIDTVTTLDTIRSGIGRDHALRQQISTPFDDPE